jgi:predicted GNAT superfamily acetyltransferase
MRMGRPPITIRPLRDHAEFSQCERIQSHVWGSAGVSAELLLVTQKNEGLVLGALAGARVVGFLYAFLGRRSGRLIHWSHLMAVEPAYRDRGLGFRLKIEHRRRALGQGVHCIAWTYDPLQSRNATLNLARLGAQAYEFIPDCYGHFPSAIERGLPTDRLVAIWEIGSERVASRLARKAPLRASPAWPHANETEVNSAGLLVNRRLNLHLDAARVLLEIPTHTDRMREIDLKLGRRWRMESRRLLQHYFGAGYYAQDFLPPGVAAAGRGFYVLARRTRRLVADRSQDSSRS